MKGATVQKVVLKTFEGQGLIGLCAKFQLSQSPPSCFFNHKYHIFENIQGKSFGSFSPALGPFCFGIFYGILIEGDDMMAMEIMMKMIT